jgi:NAD(P)-dependent dehydrogenase (short-subunit alcohol dehydrogenase family)
MGHLEDRAQLTGRRAIIVGGAEGLGEASAVDLAAAGVRVAICDRKADALAATVAAIEAAGGEVAHHGVFDARDSSALAEFFAACDGPFEHGLDILVNVVGGSYRAPFESSTPKSWDAMMRTNFTWMLDAHQLAIPRMRAAGQGSIINFTSIEGLRAAPGFAVYGAMKAAVVSLTASLGVELGPEGIRVNAIAPDYAPTPSMRAFTTGGGDQQAYDDAVLDLSTSIRIPMGREGSYEDISGVVLFLASELSGYLTGACLNPDGGAWAAKGWSNWPGLGFRNLPPRDALSPYLSDG